MNFNSRIAPTLSKLVYQLVFISLFLLSSLMFGQITSTRPPLKSDNLEDRIYLRVDYLRGTRLWSDASTPYLPELGLQGSGGMDMVYGIDTYLGLWENWKNTNRNLSGAVQFNTIYELGFSFYTYKSTSELTDYTVDYGWMDVQLIARHGNRCNLESRRTVQFQNRS